MIRSAKRGDRCSIGRIQERALSRAVGERIDAAFRLGPRLGLRDERGRGDSARPRRSARNRADEKCAPAFVVLGHDGSSQGTLCSHAASVVAKTVVCAARPDQGDNQVLGQYLSRIPMRVPAVLSKCLVTRDNSPFQLSVCPNFLMLRSSSVVSSSWPFQRERHVFHLHRLFPIRQELSYCRRQRARTMS